jgi:hypothetical protein
MLINGSAKDTRIKNNSRLFLFRTQPNFRFSVWKRIALFITIFWTTFILSSMSFLYIEDHNEHLLLWPHLLVCVIKIYPYLLCSWFFFLSYIILSLFFFHMYMWQDFLYIYMYTYAWEFSFLLFTKLLDFPLHFYLMCCYFLFNYSYI